MRTQELIEEILTRKPFDPETGKKNYLEDVIRSLGIDPDKIRFADGDFK